MAVHQRSVNILLVISLLIFLSSITIPVNRNGLYTSDNIREQETNQIADVSPTIYDWGIIGRPNESVAFIVWANVTDEDGDLANVSVHVSGPNTTIHEIMPFNGSLNVINLDAFLEIGIYDIYVSASDLANHTRVGRHVFVEIQAETTDTPDPNITMPIVVVSSLIAGFIVCVVAYFYGKRMNDHTS
jgi:hypothetical protein